MNGEKDGSSLTGEAGRELTGDSGRGTGLTVLDSVGVFDRAGVLGVVVLLESVAALPTVGFNGAFAVGVVAVLGVMGFVREVVAGLLGAAEGGVLIADMRLDTPFSAGRFFSSPSRDVTEPASELATLLFETLLLVAAR